jgi:hypothetical protein
VVLGRGSAGGGGQGEGRSARGRASGGKAGAVVAAAGGRFVVFHVKQGVADAHCRAWRRWPGDAREGGAAVLAAGGARRGPRGGGAREMGTSRGDVVRDGGWRRHGRRLENLHVLVLQGPRRHGNLTGRMRSSP